LTLYLGGGTMLLQLLEKVKDYLSFGCSVQDLEAWLVSNLQNILDSRDTKAINLANKLDADLVELHEGLIDNVTFRRRLQDYVMDALTIARIAEWEFKDRETLTSSPDAPMVPLTMSIHDPIKTQRLSLELV